MCERETEGGKHAEGGSKLHLDLSVMVCEGSDWNLRHQFSSLLASSLWRGETGEDGGFWGETGWSWLGLESGCGTRIIIWHLLHQLELPSGRRAKELGPLLDSTLAS